MSIRRRYAGRIFADSLTRIDKTVNATGSVTYKTVKIGTRDGYIDLWIDEEAILSQLGHKALRSKRGEARMASGAILAKVRKHTLRNMIDSAPEVAK